MELRASGWGLVQTEDDGTHVVLPVAGRRMASSDHAGLPVMMPRESDEEMRRDGSSAAESDRNKSPWDSAFFIV